MLAQETAPSLFWHGMMNSSSLHSSSIRSQTLDSQVQQLPESIDPPTFWPMVETTERTALDLLAADPNRRSFRPQDGFLASRNSLHPFIAREQNKQKLAQIKQEFVESPSSLALADHAQPLAFQQQQQSRHENFAEFEERIFKRLEKLHQPKEEQKLTSTTATTTPLPPSLTHFLNQRRSAFLSQQQQPQQQQPPLQQPPPPKQQQQRWLPSYAAAIGSNAYTNTNTDDANNGFGINYTRPYFGTPSKTSQEDNSQSLVLPPAVFTSEPTASLPAYQSSPDDDKKDFEAKTSPKKNVNRVRHSVSCFHCAAVSSPTWRRGPDGKLYCNACGLYSKQGKERPLALAARPKRRSSKKSQS